MTFTVHPSSRPCRACAAAYHATPRTAMHRRVLTRPPRPVMTGPAPSFPARCSPRRAPSRLPHFAKPPPVLLAARPDRMIVMLRSVQLAVATAILRTRRDCSRGRPGLSSGLMPPGRTHCRLPPPTGRSSPCSPATELSSSFPLPSSVSTHQSIIFRKIGGGNLKMPPSWKINFPDAADDAACGRHPRILGASWGRHWHCR